MRPRRSRRSQPLRICSLLPSATEIVAALELSDCLVGRSAECDWPPSVARLPVVTAARVDTSELTSQDCAGRDRAPGASSRRDRWPARAASPTTSTPALIRDDVGATFPSSGGEPARPHIRSGGARQCGAAGASAAPHPLTDRRAAAARI
jgi:hypothetical protein